MARSTGKRWCGVDVLTWLALGNRMVHPSELEGFEEELMPVDPDLLELYVSSVTIEPYVSTDFNNVDTFGAPQVYRAKIDAKEEEVLRSTGDVAVATHRVILADVFPIDERSRITLSGTRFRIPNPEIMAVRSWTDENIMVGGDHHTTLLIGARKGGKA